MKKIGVTIIAFCILAPAVFAQDLGVSVADTPPTIDGTLEWGEYPVGNVEEPVALSAARDSDGILYLLASAETDGWVAVGLGSNRMDGAHLVMAYRAGDESVIEEHSATGHFHRRSKDKHVIDAAVVETDGLTFLEFSLPEDVFYRNGEIQLILAYGPRDNLVSRHREYRRLTLKF